MYDIMPCDLPDGDLEVHTFSVDGEGSLYGATTSTGGRRSSSRSRSRAAPAVQRGSVRRGQGGTDQGKASSGVDRVSTICRPCRSRTSDSIVSPWRNRLLWMAAIRVSGRYAAGARGTPGFRASPGLGA